LTQVVGNLLNNAVKYTAEGGRIWLEVARDDGNAVLRVRDTGVGIAADMLPHVFDLFTQADRSLAHSQGGLGVGLTLVKSLVELHGGSVDARSAGADQGSEFTVRLPLLPPGALPGGPPEFDKTPANPRRRVLVVDDNIDAVESLAMVLQHMGHEVRTAADGPKALALAGAYRPELVLLDIGLPGIDGYEVARRLRKQAVAPMLLVALTGYGQEEDRRRSREAGFDQHLVKPVELTALQALLASLSALPGPA
jgi:CheY-like chemotaxis protein